MFSVGRIAFALALAGSAASAEESASVEPASAEPADPIESVYYRFAVVEYCDLADAAVAQGFIVERDRVVAVAGASEAEHRAGRIAGWTAADLEWSNRGLGGFRNWCATEGATAAAGFLDQAD
jgi:hypothetical protein